MSKAKKIPYGMTDLETIIREGYYYVAKTRLLAIDQANQYAQSKHLHQRAQSKGWTLHKFVIIFSGWKLRLIEKV